MKGCVSAQCRQMKEGIKWSAGKCVQHLSKAAALLAANEEVARTQHRSTDLVKSIQRSVEETLVWHHCGSLLVAPRAVDEDMDIAVGLDHFVSRTFQRGAIQHVCDER